MFKHEPNEIIAGLQSKLKAKTEASGRVYTVDGESKAYPSITTVLGSLSKHAIMEWRKRVGEEEANRISRKACSKGTKIHSLVEAHINNEQVNLENEMYHIQQGFGAIRKVLDERLSTVCVQESAMYSDYLRIAGRVDCIGVFDNRLSVIDFKTSSKVKERDDIQSYFMQEAAYAIMFEELTKKPIVQLVTIMAVDGMSNALVFKEHRDAWTEKLITTIKNYYINN